MPTTIGAFTVSVRAIDGNWPDNRAEATLGLTVSAPALSASVAGSPAAQVGVPYQGNAVATGLVGDAAWSVSAGALPPGVGLNAATGAIVGVPAAYGAFTAVVQVRDSYDSSRTATASLTIVVAPTAIAVTTASLPSANVGSLFAALLSASGGTGAFTWSLESGALPGGISLVAERQPRWIVDGAGHLHVRRQGDRRRLAGEHRLPDADALGHRQRGGAVRGRSDRGHRHLDPGGRHDGRRRGAPVESRIAARPRSQARSPRR